MEFGDSKKVKIKSQGVIAIHTKEGKAKYIHNVFYSSGITPNLLSVGQIMKKGYKLIFDYGHGDIFDKKDDKKVAVIQMISNNLFPLNIKTFQNVVLKCENFDESDLRHLRYSDLNFRGLQLLE